MGGCSEGGNAWKMGHSILKVVLGDLVCINSPILNPAVNWFSANLGHSFSFSHCSLSAMVTTLSSAEILGHAYPS